MTKFYINVIVKFVGLFARRIFMHLSMEETTLENIREENKMGVMPVNKLIVTMSLPMIVSMLIQALYNIVDSIFVAQISEDALTAVSLAFPFQNLMIAVGTGTGVGVNALLSRSLGEKNYKVADKVANVAVFLAIVNFLVFAVSGILFSNTFFKLQTDSNAIAKLGTDYLVICTVFSFGIFGQFCFERMLQSTGRTLLSMCTQLIGAIINIILDPCIIFGIGPFHAMGIKGAAYATVIGQIVAMFVGFALNQKYNHEITLDIKQILPEKEILKKIYSVGVPSILMASIGSLMTFCINKILIGFTSTAAAVFGVYFKLQSFIFMPVFGLNNGMVPVVAYNLGAKHFDRIKKTIKICMTYASSLMFIGIIVFQLVPETLLAFFNASEEMIKIGIPALRIISMHFVFAGVSIVCVSVFQAVGKGTYSLYVSIARQIGVLIPVAYLMSLTGNLNNVWFAFPIAECVSLLICLLYMKRIYKRVFSI